jgi:hypothetical protein
MTQYVNEQDALELQECGVLMFCDTGQLSTVLRAAGWRCRVAHGGRQARLARPHAGQFSLSSTTSRC